MLLLSEERVNETRKATNKAIIFQKPKELAIKRFHFFFCFETVTQTFFRGGSLKIICHIPRKLCF
jgi:hypothetical protein